MSEFEVLTYREIADRLGLKNGDVARSKAKRRKWEILPGNHPNDPVRVRVPSDFLRQEPRRSVPRPGDMPGQPYVALVQAHQRIADLEAALASERAEKGEMRALLRRALDVFEHERAELAALKREAAQRAPEADDDGMVANGSAEAVAALQTELDGARTALADLAEQLARARQDALDGETALETAQKTAADAAAEAEKARRDQERLRTAFDADRTDWVRERQQTRAQIETLQREAARGWLQRLMRRRGAA